MGQTELQSRKEPTAQQQGSTRIQQKGRQQVWDKFCENSDPADPTVIRRFWRLTKSKGKAIRNENTGP